MKKGIIASVIALAMTGGAAHAADVNSATINFLGSVTEATCPLAVQLADGSILQDGGEIKLQEVTAGTAPGQNAGTATTFKLVPQSASAAGCTGLAANKTMAIEWSGLDASGIKVSGSADDTVLAFTGVNTKTQNTVLNSTDYTALFAADKLTSEGFQFSVQPKAGVKKGSYNATAKFVASYQ